MSIEVGQVEYDPDGYPIISEFRFGNPELVQGLMDRLCTVVLDFHLACGVPANELGKGELMVLSALKLYVLGTVMEYQKARSASA